MTLNEGRMVCTNCRRWVDLWGDSVPEYDEHEYDVSGAEHERDVGDTPGETRFVEVLRAMPAQVPCSASFTVLPALLRV